MFKNPFKRRSSMANEQNEQAQDIQHEQAEQSNEQTQAEGVEQANDVTVESLQAQITKLEESLKLEKTRTANAVVTSQKRVR
jgi:molecular chaperone GrpE